MMKLSLISFLKADYFSACVFTLFFLSMNTLANENQFVVDLAGDGIEQKKTIINLVKEELFSWTKMINQDRLINIESIGKKMNENKFPNRSITNKIKSLGYKSVRIEYVTYPQDPVVHFNFRVDYERKSNTEHLKSLGLIFNQNQNGRYNFPESIVIDVNNYRKLSDKILRGKIVYRSEAKKQCKMARCISSFPKLARYEKSFRFIAQEKYHFIGEMLLYDRRPRYRVAAAFLLGFAKTTDDMIERLGRATADKDLEVRNNAFLTLLSIARKQDLKIYPLGNLSKLIKSYHEIDVNKAISLLEYMVEYRRNIQYVKSNMYEDIVLLTKMYQNQPNIAPSANNIINKLKGVNLQ